MRLHAILLICLTTQLCVLAVERPNVLYLFSDDQSHRTVSCYPEAYDWVDTPHLDRLATEGLRFTHAYPGAFCVPARVTALTGNLPHAVSHKVKVGNPYLRGDAMKQAQQEANFWPRRLRAHGYHTGMIGKWHLSAQDIAYGLDWDWCLWWDRNLPNNENTYFHNTKVRLNDGPPIDLGGYSTDRYTDYAEAYLRDRAKDGKPWYLWLCYGAVHQPFTPAERHKTRYQDVVVEPPASIFPPAEGRPGKPHYSRYNDMFRRTREGKPKNFNRDVIQYHQGVCALDDSVGRLMQVLKETGQLENTVVIYTSDQGLAWGQNGYRRRKITPYDHSIRAPLMVRYPKLIKSGTVSKVPVSGADLVQTIHELTGLAPLPSMDGESLVPVLKQPTAEHADRRPMITSYTRPSFGNAIPPRAERERRQERKRMQDTSLGRELDPPMWMMVRDGKYKYARYLADDYLEEIYDLEKDPDELVNLALNPEYAGKLRQLRALCEAEFRRTRSGWEPSVAPHFVELFPKPKLAK